MAELPEDIEWLSGAMHNNLRTFIANQQEQIARQDKAIWEMARELWRNGDTLFVNRDGTTYRAESVGDILTHYLGKGK